MATFDATKWHQITLPNPYSNRSMVGQPPQSSDVTGNVLFKLTDDTSVGRFWQLFPVDDTRFILRSQLSSPDTYLAIQNDATTKATGKGSVAIMRHVKGAHDEIFWKIKGFKNGGYMLTNVANGTDWRLHAESFDTVSMTNNFAVDQDNQTFGISVKRFKINDAAYSSAQLPSGAYTTLASASSNEPSSGLASGTKIAIGVSVSVGVLLLVAAIVGVCFVLRRRRKKQSVSDKAELDGTNEQERQSVAPTIKYRSEVQELEGQSQIQELGGNERAHGAGSLAELSADGTNNRRYQSQ